MISSSSSSSWSLYFSRSSCLILSLSLSSASLYFASALSASALIISNSLLFPTFCSDFLTMSFRNGSSSLALSPSKALSFSSISLSLSWTPSLASLMSLPLSTSILAALASLLLLSSSSSCFCWSNISFLIASCILFLLLLYSSRCLSKFFLSPAFFLSLSSKSPIRSLFSLMILRPSSRSLSISSSISSYFFSISLSICLRM
mmetsp:Transcript_9065/g.8640  ORF Transcript_9065/g.8640 Transcript_9065/m.8640 type:complete len:203 (+) Transcript_9065:1726-2334(+)